MIFYRYSIYFIFFFGCLILKAQQQKKVDFLTAKIKLQPNAVTKSIGGEVTYNFKTIAQVDSVFLDAKSMQFSKVLVNNKKVTFTTNGKQLTVFKKFKKGKEYKLHIVYSATPKQTLYFFGWNKDDNKNNQIWTQGQGKYTSHWLPSFDDMTEKVEFDLSLTFAKEYEVIANGKLENTKIKDNLKTWHFNMNYPMSSYLLAFAIGKYHEKEELSASGIPLKMYYYPKDSTKVESTYRYSKQIFNFLEQEIGVPYPWQVYKQIPVRDFLYAGMENTSTTIFSDAYIVDSIAYTDKNYTNINAHELAHQWFGDLVTEISSKHHWLHEGFATYYAYLAEKELFGEDYFNWKLFDTAMQLDKSSKNGTGEALTNPKASSLTFYEKGAWALHALQLKIGKDAFKKGVQSYLETYKFKNVTVENFLTTMEKASGQKLSTYKKIWLQDTIFPMDKAKQIFKETSTSIASFYKLQRELSVSKESNEAIIDRYWTQHSSTEFKKHIVDFYTKSLSRAVKNSILKSTNVGLRQSFLLSAKVSSANKRYFESFLSDKSYLTIENTLYKLWINFPENRVEYLDKTKGIVGFSTKNVRQLWLALALMTKSYDIPQKEQYLKELQGYTSPVFNFETRQLAFSYLNDLFRLNDDNLVDLARATNHPVWQFKKFSRNLVNAIISDKRYRKKFKKIKEQISEEEFRYIKSKL